MAGGGTKKNWPYKRYGLTTGLLILLWTWRAAGRPPPRSRPPPERLPVSVTKHFYYDVLDNVDMNGSKI